MRWTLIVSSALLICFTASDVFAGRIFGDIKVDGKPAPAGITVKIALAPAPSPAPETKSADAKPAPSPAVIDSTVTDKFGSYKLTVKENGKCILTVMYEKEAFKLEVFSYKDPTRYDLILEKKDGKRVLRRK